ncbi:hypothetical protein VD17_12655 [Pseudomonas fluorescens]|uniref:Uncharacterized protein n=1 Tax=Pseudomonas fluorescens TaxID=294 RepID=A0A0F4V9K0_PSEFL|nr:hypothetical protein VD17_12655 [Pseudomonas fluorescens]
MAQRCMAQNAYAVHRQHRLPAPLGIVLIDHIRQVNIRLNVMIAIDLAKQLAHGTCVGWPIGSKNQMWHHAVSGDGAS